MQKHIQIVQELFYQIVLFFVDIAMNGSAGYYTLQAIVKLDIHTQSGLSLYLLIHMGFYNKHITLSLCKHRLNKCLSITFS